MKRRVVVTGLGVLSPVGLCLKDFKESLQKGLNGEGPITSFDATTFPAQRAFEIKNFDAHPFGTHLLDPFIQYAVAATSEAVGDARFECGAVEPHRIGISVSSSKGGVHTLDRFRTRLEKNPSAILGARVYCNSVPNFAAQWIARRWKIQGPAKCYVAACATGTVAVVEGARMVAAGTVDYCIAGATDASIVPLMIAGYHNMKALSNESLRPFDKNRSGFLVGEGAGIVFLESLESAKARGVKIYGEIIDSAHGCDGTHPIHFSREENALARTLKILFERTGLTADDIGYINLHGTGTREGDAYETDQIKKFFGGKAYHIPMSSIKGATGHMLGASGAVEIIASLLAMEEGFIPPTVGLVTLDPQLDLDYNPGKSKRAKIEKAISISMGFGGQIAVIALGKI